MTVLPRAAGCLVVKDGKVLAVSRKDDHTKFGIPAGKADGDETTEQTAIRELFEETGLVGSNLKFVFACVCKGKKDYWTVTYTADISGNIHESTDEGVVKWVSPEELIAGPFGEYNKALFNAVGIKYA